MLDTLKTNENLIYLPKKSWENLAVCKYNHDLYANVSDFYMHSHSQSHIHQNHNGSSFVFVMSFRSVLGGIMKTEFHWNDVLLNVLCAMAFNQTSTHKNWNGMKIKIKTHKKVGKL